MVRRQECIFGIDLGTSGPKVALVSMRGEVIGSEFEPVRLILHQGGGAEQDPREWWGGIVRAAGRLLSRCPEYAESVVAVSCTAQWSGTVPIDCCGEPLDNALIWMDTRGVPYVRDVVKGILTIRGYGVSKLLTWIHLTGGAPALSGKDSIAHILYLKHKRPDVYRSTYKFLEPKDYINLRLTGRVAASYDSIALHWLTDNRNIDYVKYHPMLLSWCGVSQKQFPPLVRATDIVGVLLPHAADQLGLPRGIPVICGTPDIQSAMIGSGAVEDYAPHLYLGTSSWLTCHVPFKKVDMFHNMTSLPSALPGRYFIANEQECAGACIGFLKDVIFGRETGASVSHGFIDALAENTAAGSGNIIFTPWLYGERTPIEDGYARGGFHNLSLGVSQGMLARSVLEGVAYNTRWLLGYVERFAQKQFGSVAVIGGGANSNVWCQIFADVLNRPIRQIAQPTLANVRGAALLAAVALGRCAVSEIPQCAQIKNAYEPNPSMRTLYDGLFEEFKMIYRSTRGMYHRLNRGGAR